MRPASARLPQLVSISSSGPGSPRKETQLRARADGVTTPPPLPLPDGGQRLGAGETDAAWTERNLHFSPRLRASALLDPA